MTSPTPTPFEKFLLEKDVVGLNREGLTLKSGKVSHWYANFRVLSCTHAILQKTATFVADFLIEQKLITDDCDGVLGVPEGATLLGLEVQRILVKRGIVTDTIYSLRAKTKDHGDAANRFWTNGNIPTKVILLEDVTTTAGSALETKEKLETAGVTVTHIIALLNRMQVDDNDQSVIEKMEVLGMSYKALTDASRILPALLQMQEGSDCKDFTTMISEEYKKEYEGKNVIPVKL